MVGSGAYYFGVVDHCSIPGQQVIADGSHPATETVEEQFEDDPMV
jgi:hypothetical protein